MLSWMLRFERNESFVIVLMSAERGPGILRRLKREPCEFAVCVFWRSVADDDGVACLLVKGSLRWGSGVGRPIACSLLSPDVVASSNDWSSSVSGSGTK